MFRFEQRLQIEVKQCDSLLDILKSKNISHFILYNVDMSELSQLNGFGYATQCLLKYMCYLNIFT